MLKTYVAVKALIKNGDKFLILKTEDSDQNNPLIGWETPGGRLNDAEDIMVGLDREIKEETGLEVKVFFPFNTYTGSLKPESEIIGINYLAEYISGEVKMDPGEHVQYKWVTKQEIRDLKENIGLQLEFDAYERFLGEIKNI
jgi:ADP-ribose pyrophosphatase YjhB (NUDIX family)